LEQKEVVIEPAINILKEGQKEGEEPELTE